MLSDMDADPQISWRQAVTIFLRKIGKQQNNRCYVVKNPL